MTALNHGLEEECEKVKQILQLQEAQKRGINIEEEGIPEISLPQNSSPNAKLLVPPKPIIQVASENWPTTRVHQSRFEIDPSKKQKQTGLQSIEVPEANW